MKHNPSRQRGFTMVELLVVIGIIGILMMILIPVVNSMKERAYIASTASQIGALRSAIEAYQQTFHSYPGPLSDKQMVGMEPLPAGLAAGPNGITGTENLVLGLIGGLRNNGTQVMYNAQWVGTGPAVLQPNGKVYGAFYDAWAAEISDRTGTPYTPRDTGLPGGDSSIPEFLDRFDQPLPLLYMRARVGAPGIVGDRGSPLAQYDVANVRGYTARNVFSATKPHGLQAVGGTNANLVDGINQAWTYLRDPSSPTSGNATFPRSRDAFILISAGPDRLYGTLDDVTSFGSLSQ